MLRIILKLFNTNAISEEFIRRFDDDANTDTLSKEEKSAIIKEISGVENVDQFLEDMLKKDRITFFNAPIERQDMVRGAFTRTLWLLDKIRNMREKTQKESKKVKLNSHRHG